MHGMLSSMNYNGWILTTLLLLPVLGAVMLSVQAAGSGQADDATKMSSARRTALLFFTAQAVISLG